MNILSLFDGISCAQQAINKASIKYDKYYASEIDKHAIKATQINFSNTIQLGSVTDWDRWDIDFSSIDLIVAGSPCQGFSFAGKKLAFNDPRSKLFFVFVDILRYVQKRNPNVKYLLENVYMKKEHERVITNILGVNPIKINSSLLSAQSRKRNYWTNIGLQPMGLFGDLESTIKQPKDKGIMLRDILQPESEVNEKYYLSEKMINWLTKHSIKRGTEFKKLDGNQKASTITTTEAKQNLSNDYITCISQRGSGIDNTQQIEDRKDGKTNTITSVQKDNMVLQINPSKESGGKQPFQQNRIYDIDGKNPALCSQLSTGSNNIQTEDFLVRRLTPIEVCRLQTISDDYFFKEGKQIISDSQIYKACGNGFTVDIIAYILSRI